LVVHKKEKYNKINLKKKIKHQEMEDLEKISELLKKKLIVLSEL
jgi:hypothetical protein